MNIGSVQAAKGAYGQAVYKFGFNSAITTDEETVWDVGGIYSYPSSAGIATIVSTSTADDLVGTGAQKIKIEGLDANYQVQIVEVEMDGTTNVVTTETFIRVYRVFVSQAGSGKVNAGNITISVGGAVIAQISANQGQSLMAVYTIPSGFTGYITQWSFSSGSSASNKYLDGRLIIQRFSGVIQTKARSTIHNNSFTQDLSVATVANQKDDIEIRAVTSSGTDAVSGTFSVLLKRD